MKRDRLGAIRRELELKTSRPTPMTDVHRPTVLLNQIDERLREACNVVERDRVVEVGQPAPTQLMHPLLLGDHHIKVNHRAREVGDINHVVGFPLIRRLRCVPASDAARHRGSAAER